MKFERADAVEQICSSLLMADQVRARDRADINNLFNGAPPFPADTEGVNTNFLDATNIAHHGRNQLYSAFINPNPLFTVELDYGPTFKRREWASIIQKEMNKIIKDSQAYLEVRQSTFANVVLHGIGPSMWENKEQWTPDDLGVEDVLLPANTYRSMKGLPLFCIRRAYTVPQIQKLTRGPHLDPGWQMDVVKACIEWADKEAQALLGSNWNDTWSPEKISERMKGSEYFYSDAVPTINAFDFYFHDDDAKTSGWKRRMILDAWSGGQTITLDRKNDLGKGKFLYNSEDRIYADDLSKILSFNFADCSSVAPFRYHSIRSLGYLIYSICHLQNRLRCSFSNAVFESLLQYFRVANPADMDRLMKINLTDKGVLEDGVQFVKPEERWQINENLVLQAMQLNRQTMQDNSASFTQDLETSDQRNQQETATRTIAKVNATTALVGAMLNQAYNYQVFEYREICRRFFIENSANPDAKKFQVRCLKQGVPKEALSEDATNVQPVRVVGSGNKLMASAIADKLMAVYAQLDPTAQKETLRLYVASNSDDYNLADRLVPKMPVVSDTIHDSEIVFGSLMQGSRVTPKPGLNPSEVVETMLRQMSQAIQEAMQTGGVGTPELVAGLTRAAQYADAFIQMLAKDRNEKARVAAYGKELGKLMNMVKAFQQRQQQAAQKAQNGNGADPELKSKIDATLITAQTKSKIAAENHAAKTAQKQIAFEEKLRMDGIKHQADLDADMREHAAELAKTTLETHHAVATNRLKVTAKPGGESS